MPKQAIYLLLQFLGKKPCPAHIAIPADYYPGGIEGRVRLRVRVRVRVSVGVRVRVRGE